MGKMLLWEGVLWVKKCCSEGLLWERENDLGGAVGEDSHKGGGAMDERLVWGRYCFERDCCVEGVI